MPKFIFTVAFVILYGSFAAAQTIERTQAANISSKPVTVLSTPKVDYTNAARRKGVEGVVKLLVVFKSDGTIGEIRDVSAKKKKLEKYGLTAQAIEASKKINFVTATADGQPVNVSKIVEYGFDLY